MGSSGGYITYPRIFSRKEYEFHSIHRTRPVADSISKELNEKGYLVRVIPVRSWYAIYFHRKLQEEEPMKKQSPHHPEKHKSTRPSTRHSGSKGIAKGNTHRNTLALKRATRRGDASKENTAGYGWDIWRKQLRRDNIGKKRRKKGKM